MTQGKPLHIILKFAIPIVLGNILQNIYTLTDTAIVGKIIGSDALVAVGATGDIIFFIMVYRFEFAKIESEMKQN